jgi:hypothetical protein
VFEIRACFRMRAIWNSLPLSVADLDQVGKIGEIHRRMCGKNTPVPPAKLKWMQRNQPIPDSIPGVRADCPMFSIMRRQNIRCIVALSLLLGAADPARGIDRIVFRGDPQQVRVEGKLLVEAEDGGLLLMSTDGLLWSIPADKIMERSRDNQVFRPVSAEQMERLLLAELPAGFEVQRTKHYVIGYDTSRAYANWCKSLLERLYRAFLNYWTRRGFELRDPDLPLTVLIFSHSDMYRQYARVELGDAADTIVGYYSLRTNRILMYDLTGAEALRGRGARRGSVAEINHMLNHPQAEPLVATVIHEATHQIAFNCGLMTRYADVPLWVSEGLAIYFETPDLESSDGWRGIGEVNRSRLARFQRNLPARSAGSLASILADDERMRNLSTSADAYAEAWAVNHFFIHQRSQQYVEYLRMLSKKKELVWDDRQTRLDEFKKHFGHDMEALDQQFVRYMQKLR